MNEDFNIPYYIFEQLVSYIENGKSIIEWENIKVLFKIARLNNRLTKEQIEFLEKKYK